MADDGTSGSTSPGTIGSGLDEDTVDTIRDSTPDTSDAGDVIQDLVDTVLSAVLNQIVSPLYRGFLYLGIIAAGVLSALFLGSDLELGVSEGSWPGIADIPLFSVELVIDVLQPVASVPLSIIESVNETLVSLVAQLGVAAPIVMLVLGAAEIVALGWLLFRVAELLQVGAILKTATGPVRAAWGLLR